MNILLIGHNGYVGSGLDAYFRHDHRVLGWGSQDDILSLSTEYLRAEKIELIVNCAVIQDRTTTDYSLNSPTDAVNVQGPRHLASILQGTAIGWIQVSTKDVFGPVYNKQMVKETALAYRPLQLVDEGQPYSPQTIYAKSKLMAEFISEHHPRSTVLRLSSCFSDFDHHRGTWVTGLIKDALFRNQATVTHNGKQFRDPLHLDDFGQLIELIARKNLWGHKLNVGGGTTNIISLLEFVQLVNPKAQILKVPGDDFGFAFDTRLVRQLSDWKPRIDIRKRLPLIIDNVRQGKLALA